MPPWIYIFLYKFNIHNGQYHIAKETVDPIKKMYVSEDDMIGEDRVVPAGTNEQNDNDQSAGV